MLKFAIVVLKNEEVEDAFENFILNNEICTVQESIQYIDNYNMCLEMVPAYDEDKVEFMQLCNALIEFFEEKGYEV